MKGPAGSSKPAGERPASRPPDVRVLLGFSIGAGLLVALAGLGKETFSRRVPDSWIPVLVGWFPFVAMILAWALLIRARRRAATPPEASPLDIHVLLGVMIITGLLIALGRLGAEGLSRRMPDSWLPVLAAWVPIPASFLAWALLFRARRRKAGLGT